MGKEHYKDETLMTAFGNHVKELRISRDMSIRAFANACDVEHSTIARIESGQMNPTLSMIFLLAENLDVTIQELMTFKKK